MPSKLLKPLVVTCGLGLLPACPAEPGTTGSTGEATWPDPPMTDALDPTTGPASTGPTTGEPTTDPTTSGPTTDPSSTGDTSDTATDTDDATTGGLAGLCDRLGGAGAGGIDDLVGGFLDIALADDRINGYFLNQDVDAGHLAAMLSAQLGELAGCEGVVYTGLGMKEAHAGLGVSALDFMDFVADFTTALAAHTAQHAELSESDRAAVVELLAATAPDIVEDADNDGTVYQRVGRKPAIEQIIGGPDLPGSLLGLVLADPAIAGFFVMSDPVRLATCLTRQVAGIDGPVDYMFEVDSPAPGVDEGVGVGNECRDMVSAHASLQDAEMTFITADDFGALVGHLVTAMDAAGVAAADQTTIVDALGSLCDQIVVGSGEKNRCAGNFKAQTVLLPALGLPLKDGVYDGTLASMLCSDIVVGEDVDEIGFVEDIEVILGLDHTWAGDVTLKVQSPGGAILTVFNRPGNAQYPDDGTDCCNDDSDLSKDFPLRFRDGAINDAAKIGTKIGAMKIVCKDDTECEFFPNPGKGPGVDFGDFRGETGAGIWRVCVGDSNDKDLGTLDHVGLTLNKVRYDPTP